MRGRRGLLIGTIGMGFCLVAGCLQGPVPREVRIPRSSVAAHPPRIPPDERKKPDPDPDPPPSDYNVSATPTVTLDVQTTASSAKPVEPAELRIKEEKSPQPPAELPQAKMEIHPAPAARPDAPPVQVLRALLEHRPEEEIKEQLKAYDEVTRRALVLLMQSIVELEQSGGIAVIAPRDLAAWSERLNALTASLRGRAQLNLEKMCFCSYIKNFGDFAPLPPEHSCFQPGEIAHVYVQVRNFASRQQKDRYVTSLKGRMEFFEENNHDKPMITWDLGVRHDYSVAPRQDYFINFRFEVPHNCPAGLYTVRITVEDWTDVTPESKQVPASRIAQRTLDFRVGGAMPRPARTRIVDRTTSR